MLVAALSFGGRRCKPRSSRTSDQRRPLTSFRRSGASTRNQIRSCARSPECSTEPKTARNVSMVGTCSRTLDGQGGRSARSRSRRTVRSTNPVFRAQSRNRPRAAMEMPSLSVRASAVSTSRRTMQGVDRSHRQGVSLHERAGLTGVADGLLPRPERRSRASLQSALVGVKGLANGSGNDRARRLYGSPQGHCFVMRAPTLLDVTFGDQR